MLFTDENICTVYTYLMLQLRPGRLSAVICQDCSHIHHKLPQIKELYLRSDNAGCYKNAVLIPEILQCIMYTI